MSSVLETSYGARENIWQFTWPRPRLIEVGRYGRDAIESFEEGDDRPFFLRIAGHLSANHSLHAEEKKFLNRGFFLCLFVYHEP